MADPAPDTIARLSADGFLHFRGATYRAAFGRGGIHAHKQEGDQATPAALLPLRRVLYRADRITRPRTTLPVEPIAPNDGWCDDPANPAYNQQVQLPFPARHEELWRRDALYDLIGILGWNDKPVVRGRGSAIFLHVARGDFAPTEGCIALELADLLRILEAGCQAVDARS